MPITLGFFAVALLGVFPLWVLSIAALLPAFSLKALALWIRDEDWRACLEILLVNVAFICVIIATALAVDPLGVQDEPLLGSVTANMLMLAASVMFVFRFAWFGGIFWRLIPVKK